MSYSITIGFSLMGGILPALLWLWFWLKEDRLHPEPKSRIALLFLMGMVSVFLVLPIEKLIYSFFSGNSPTNIALLTVVLWAATEEVFKFLAAYFGALKTKIVDEPIDAVIYMITTALGFSALENALFLSNLLDTGLISQTIITGNSRFLGATLLHTACSAAVGVLIGLAYYKKPLAKRIFLFTGLAFGIILHSVFNLLIIKLENETFFVFAGVWVLIISLIVLIEKVKVVRFS